jgi:hypothetical protein
MTLSELESALDLIVDDASLKTHFKTWINNIVKELAEDFDLPALRLIEAVALNVTTSNWLYNMPSSYMKKLFRCRNSNSDKVTICRSMDSIESLDYDHDETGDYVTHVAVQDKQGVSNRFQIGIFPKANDTLSLWFYERPTVLTLPGDELTCIPDRYQDRVVIPKVVIKNWELLQDLVVDAPHNSLKWWKDKYRIGLYGEPHGDIGMINCFARDRKPRRHGGSDPLP